MQATVHTVPRFLAALPKPRANVPSSFREITQQQHEMDEIMDLLKRIGRGWVEEIRRQLQQALDHQTDVTNRKFEEITEKIEKLSQLQQALHQALDHQTDVTHRKLEQLAERADNESNSTIRRFEELAERVDNESNSIIRRFDELTEQLSQKDKSRSLLGERTDDPLHRTEQKLLRASQGKIFNHEKPCNNPAFTELLKLANGDEVAD